MTLIVGWLACDQRGPCSAYIASDSRISNNKSFYDNSQKTFALKNTPDILGYCGEMLFTQLSQLISANNACINLACEAIQSVTLLFMQAVISADSVEICSTNRAIRLWRASVNSISWMSSQNMKNNSP